MNLFTYGTLMRGGCRGGLLEPCGARFLGEATLPHVRLFELSTGAFPVAMPSRFEEDFVTGELYEIPDSIFFYGGLKSALDQIESDGTMYLRQNLPVKLNGETVIASVYIGEPFFWDYNPDLCSQRLKAAHPIQYWGNKRWHQK